MVNFFARDSIYLVENNEIYLENNGNVLELRENAKEISFQSAFNILKENIDPVDIIKFQQFQDIKISNLVKDYQIQSEKINDIKYYANISVNFSKEKVKSFFSKNNIIINTLVSDNNILYFSFV